MEKILWAAVLQQAIEDIRTKRASKDANRYRDSAMHWMYESKERGVGSLWFVCDVLDVDMSYVRARTMR